MLRPGVVGVTAIIAVLAGGITACSSPAAKAGSTASAVSADQGTQRPRLTGHVACPDTPGFTCARLRVPLDHGRRHPGTLELPVAMANNADAPRGVLLFLSGGPGQPGVALVNRLKTYLAPEVLQQYRMVMFDQRGTGPGGINCADLQAAVGGSDFLTPPRDAVVACGAQLGRGRDFYRSTDTVDDIEWLRQALDQSRITIDGVSYGSYTGALYGLKYPARVNALILDSVVPHSGFDPFAIEGMAATKRVLSDACRRDAACKTDPVADLAWLVRHGEIDGKPINGTSFTESFSVNSLNAVDPTFKGIPQLLHDARNGNTAPLKEYFQQYSSGNTPYDQLSAGLHMATFCTDLRFPWGTSATPQHRRQAALDRAVRRMRSADLYPFDAETARNMLAIEGCLHWQPAKPAVYPRNQRLLPPTLILHGTNDLFCPVDWAHWEKRHAARAELVITPGGHGVQGSRTDPTGKNAVRDFLLR